MRTFFSVLLYAMIFAFLGTLAVAFYLHLITLEDATKFLSIAFHDSQYRLITGLTGALLILFGMAAAQAFSSKIQREKTIAFTNPNGQVTITLSAVEDLIKRLTNQLTDLKEAKANVRATKRGIDIRMRVVLRSETNIPDFTARLQDMIASKIQDVFGIDEKISVKIHVAKIATSDEKPKKKQDPESEDFRLPYQGMKI
jgi:uncharacterized alkaline shock family protein YloU